MGIKVMDLRKFLGFLLVFTLLSSSLYAIGIFNKDGSFTYYISAQEPFFEVSLNSPYEQVVVDSVELYINGQNYIHNLNVSLDIGEDFNSTFPLSVFGPIGNLSPSDSILFNINVINIFGKDVNTLGTPKEFRVVVDTTAPILVDYFIPRLGVFGPDDEFSMIFTEEIYSYSLSSSGENQNYKLELPYEEELQREFVGIPISFLREGQNTVALEARDIAGNLLSQNLDFTYRGPPLEISLLTKQKGDSVDYSYGAPAGLEHFFKKTVYTSKSSINLKLQTSKDAICYLVELFSNATSISTLNLNDLPSKKQLSSSNNKDHSISINPTSQGLPIWIACQNTQFETEVAYLSSSQDFKAKNNDAILVKRLTELPFEIVDLSPQNQLTTNDFSIRVETNVKAYCYVEVNGAKELLTPVSTGTVHKSIGNSLPDGTHSLDFECYDLLGRSLTRQTTLSVDTNLGPKVASSSPEYTDKSTELLTIVLSEPLETCRVTRAANATYEGATALQGIGISKTYQASGLELGDNTFKMLCVKDNVLYESTFDLTYDPNGPEITNLSFYNNGIRSDFATSHSELVVRFDVSGFIDTKKFYVSVFGTNDSQEFVKTSKAIKLKGDFADSSRLRIIAENLLGKNGTPAEKLIQFDLEPPQLSVSASPTGITIGCFDTSGECLEVRYGFSQTSFTCHAKTFYTKEIEPSNFNYICVLGTDNVGHEAYIVEQIGSSFNESSEESLDDLYERLGEDENQTNTTPEEEDPFVSKPVNTSTSGGEGSNGLLIIGATFFFLIVAGSGGYYAYRKGYLNDQLAKLGFHVPDAGESSSHLSGGPDLGTKKKEEKLGKKVKGSSYDDHLKKLTSFIDKALDKRNSVFDSFKSSSKGGHQKYDDTLSKEGKHKASQEDFDEFYDKGDSSSSSTNVKSDAQDFEEYYKKKKTKK